MYTICLGGVVTAGSASGKYMLCSQCMHIMFLLYILCVIGYLLSYYSVLHITTHIVYDFVGIN